MAKHAHRPLNHRLRSARIARGISAVEAARRVGCSGAHLSHFENGRRDPRDFSPRFIRDLAEAVGVRVTTAELFEPEIAPLPRADRWARAEASKR